jgi:hypothetical protein
VGIVKQSLPRGPTMVRPEVMTCKW